MTVCKQFSRTTTRHGFVPLEPSFIKQQVCLPIEDVAFVDDLCDFTVANIEPPA